MAAAIGFSIELANEQAGTCCGNECRPDDDGGHQPVLHQRSMSGPVRGRRQIVKVAAHLERAGRFEPARLDRLEAGRSDQPLNFLASTVVVGGVEEDRELR